MAVGGLRGLDDVLRNMNREIVKIEGRTLRGITRSQLLVEQVVIPITPKRTGHLRGTFKRPPARMTAHGPIGKVEFKAGYAIYVHEIEREHYHTAGTGWKYLERALRVCEKPILNIIAEEARIL